MSIDASIYNNIKPVQIDSPLNALAQVAQLRSAQNQNKLFDMQATASQRALDSDAALSSLLAGGKSGADVVNGLAAKGFGKDAMAYAKTQREQEKTDADIGLTKSNTKKADQETANHQFEIVGQIVGSWAQDPTVSSAKIQAGLAAAANSKLISPEIYQAKLAELQNVPQDAGSLNKWAQGTLAQVLKAKDQMAFIAPDANTKLTADTSRANNKATVGATIRGQNLTDARSRETLNQGKVPAGYRANADGTMSAIPGGPADLKFGKEGAQKVSDAKDVLGLLDEIDAILPKATNGLVGVTRDSVAGAFGKSTDGANATAQLKALQGSLVSKMPKMSGPQSDKDVQLYREMAGQVGDPLVPRAQRQAASSTIRKLNEKYAGMAEGSSKHNAVPSDIDELLKKHGGK